MTMSGKSALRKKRFKKAPWRYTVAARSSVPEPPWFSGLLTLLLRLAYQLFPEHTHEGKVPVALGEVEAVADHEAVGNLEADVAAVDVALAPLRLGHERAHVERGRLARLERAQEVREREARVDDILDDEDVPSLDRDVEVLENAHDARGVDPGAVARHGHEVDLAGDVDRAHEVGHEEDGALEHADEEEVAAAVVPADLGAELGDPRLERRLVDQDLFDRGAELAHLAHPTLSSVTASSQPGAAAIPGTTTTSSPRTTRGYASRSERGTFASTKRS